ncbi:hypothetical protein [Neobacillus vireti]|uniref:hypothetical protein n=1 Tax=Neobacillus vireti TaxID=220686 RepID=UPI002FFE9391
MAIIYISILIIGYTTSNTNAHFNAKHEITEKIQARTWAEQSPMNAVESPIITNQVIQTISGQPVNPIAEAESPK